MHTEQTVRLLVTSGDGPRECRRAITQCIEKMEREAANKSLSFEVTKVNPDDDQQSLLVRLTGPDAVSFAGMWTGTIRWTSPSPFRPHHKRSNWFVGVFLLPPERLATELEMRDIRLESFRAGGPGGQHQNTTDSAVRVTHVPTGISVIARDDRSRHRNEATAIARLRDRLLLADMQKASADQSEERQLHKRLERGNPVRSFKGPNFLES